MSYNSPYHNSPKPSKRGKRSRASVLQNRSPQTIQHYNISPKPSKRGKRSRASVLQNRSPQTIQHYNISPLAPQTKQKWQNRPRQVDVDYSDADLDSMDVYELDDIVQSLKAENDELRETNSTLTKQITTSGNTVQQFRKQNASLQQQMSHLRQENTKSQSILRNEATKLRKEVATAENKLKKISQEKASLQNEAKKLREEIARLKQIKKEEISYSIRPITSKKDIKLKDKLSQINKNIHFKDYNETFSHQRQVIDEWNVNTKKLQNIQSQIEKTKTIKVLSDSDDMKTDTASNELLKSYVACNELKAAQSKRLYTNDNVQQLFKKKNSICDHLEANEQKTTSYSNRNTTYQSQYQMTQTQRKALIQTIDATVKECNQTINKENKLFEHIQQTQNMLNLLRRQKEQLIASANSCDVLMNEYQTFETINADAIQAIEGHFDTQWDGFEQRWAQWKRVDIISWFKYQTIERNTSNVDWKNVETQMKTRNINNGASLDEFVTSTLDLIGIVDFNIASFLMKKITYLVTKYPKRSKTPYGDEGRQKTTHEAPKEFYCAYTKEMMKDPVLAFDGKVYEREAIQKYLKEHGESPVTKKKASTTMLWPQKGLKLRIQEYQSND
eukprot:1092053_1